MSINQSHGGGAILCIYHHTASQSQPTHRMYFIGLPWSGSGTTTTLTYTEVAGLDLESDSGLIYTAGTGFGNATFDVSSQNTLMLNGTKGDNYWHLIACGNIMV